MITHVVSIAYAGNKTLIYTNLSLSSSNTFLSFVKFRLQIFKLRPFLIELRSQLTYFRFSLDQRLRSLFCKAVVCSKRKALFSPTRDYPEDQMVIFFVLGQEL